MSWRIPIPSFAAPADSPPPASAPPLAAAVSTQSHKRFPVGNDRIKSKTQGRGNHNNHNTKSSNSSKNKSKERKEPSQHPTNTTAAATMTNDIEIEGLSKDDSSHWNVTHLLRLEGAMQQYLRQKGAANKTKSNDTAAANSQSVRLSLDEFYAVASKLDWQHKATGKKNDQLQSYEEELLRQLIVVTANPTLGDRRLYRMLEPLQKNISDNNDNNNMNSKDWSLEQAAVQTGSKGKHWSRMTQLKNLVASSSSQDDLSWSTRVTAWIVAHRNFKASTVVSACKPLAPSKMKTHTTPYHHHAKIVAGMTVDERVRARAHAKEQNRQQQQQLANGENKDSNDPKTMDRMWLIQFADALWSHARHLVRRQRQALPSKMASQSQLFPMTRAPSSAMASSKNLFSSKVTLTAKNTAGRPCILTFADVVDTMARSRLGKLPSRQIAKALKELQNYEPQWLTVVNAAGKNEHNKTDDGDANRRCNKKQKKVVSSSSGNSHLSKSAIIWIYPEHYPAVRDQMTGHVGPRKILSPIPMSLSTIVAPNNASNGAIQHKRPSPESRTKANLLENFDRGATSQRKRLKVIQEKEAKAPTDDDATGDNTSSTTCISTPTVQNKKRSRSVDAAATAPASSAKTSQSNTKKKLRINNKLILSDADYHGGEVLEPSELDDPSPRGLKRLFRQLNSGERI